MFLRYILYLLLGLLLGCALIFYSRSFKPQIEKRILTIALVVAAAIYIGFAAFWGTIDWLFIEIAGVPVYGAFVWASIRYSGYWLAWGWLLHPIWDGGLHLFGPGVFFTPEWYVVACISFDLVVAGYIFFRAGSWKLS